MKQRHTPCINARYWTAITLASVFGTNMGDLYAHELHLGIGKGLALLAVLAALVFVAERFVMAGREVYYWLVIVIIRTGATNIADYLMYRTRVSGALLTFGFAALIALFGWRTHRIPSRDSGASNTLPGTSTMYWLAMLSAGVFGTVAGDLCEHGLGDGLAAIALLGLLLALLFSASRRAAQVVAIYWTVVAAARMTGTAIGDWLAENKVIHIGLPLSTLLSGIAFVAVLTVWRTRASVPAYSNALEAKPVIR